MTDPEEVLAYTSRNAKTLDALKKLLGSARDPNGPEAMAQIKIREAIFWLESSPLWKPKIAALVTNRDRLKRQLASAGDYRDADSCDLIEKELETIEQQLRAELNYG
jgi:hypothetical protein